MTDVLMKTVSQAAGLILLLLIPCAIWQAVKHKKKHSAPPKQAGTSRVHIPVADFGGNLPGESPDAVVWDGDKSAAKRADIDKGLF
jgi:hypothetical protein